MCKFYKALILILALGVATLPLTGCGDEEESFTSDSESDGETPPEDGGGDNLPPAEPETFKLNVSTSGLGWLSLLHKSTDIGDECSVAPGATDLADQYITCFLDVQEGSAYASEVDLNFKVPPNMCRYLQHNPYRYMNWETGIGPQEIWIQTNTNAAGDILGYRCAEGPGPHDPATMGPCAGLQEWSVNQGSEICQYNHSVSDPTAPNCCTGSYVIHTQSYDVDAATVSAVDFSDASWGERGSSCTGGPAARDPDWPVNSNGVPMSQIYQTWNEGLDETYTFRAPIDLTQQSNRAGDESANVASYNDFIGATPTPLNTGYSDRSGDFIATAERDYEFWCLDEAFEVEFSINLRLREWNTATEYVSLLDTGAGNPNTVGTEGVDCDFESPEAGQCNDKWDWDDMVNDADLFPEHLWD